MGTSLMGQGALIFHYNLLESTYHCEHIFSNVVFWIS